MCTKSLIKLIICISFVFFEPNTNNTFSNRVINPWNKSSKETVTSSSINTFKTHWKMSGTMTPYNLILGNKPPCPQLLHQVHILNLILQQTRTLVLLRCVSWKTMHDCSKQHTPHLLQRRFTHLQSFYFYLADERYTSYKQGGGGGGGGGVKTLIDRDTHITNLTYPGAILDRLNNKA